MICISEKFSIANPRNTKIHIIHLIIVYKVAYTNRIVVVSVFVFNCIDPAVIVNCMSLPIIFIHSPPTFYGAVAHVEWNRATESFGKKKRIPQNVLRSGVIIH